MRMMILLFALALCACAETKSVSRIHTCALSTSVASHVVKIETNTALGSGVLIKPGELLTVRHVSKNAGVGRTWRHVSLSQRTGGPGENWRTAERPVRIKHTIQSNVSEDLDIWEVASPLDWNPDPLIFRTSPLHHGDLLQGIGYTDGSLASSFGKFRADGPVADVPGDYVRFKVDYKDGKIDLGPGTSGGGIFDCEGRLVGLLSTTASWERGLIERFLFGSFNVYVAPISVAREMFK